jgi:hypothetical protein
MPRSPKSVARRKDEALWLRIVSQIKAGSRGGLPGQWSARKAQLAVKEYKDAGGRYVGPKRRDNSLARWTKQQWTTKSGRPSLETGERYLPKRAIKSLSSSEYRSTTREKRRSLLKGEQFSRQPKKIASKVKRFRKNPDGVLLLGLAASATLAFLWASGKLNLS